LDKQFAVVHFELCVLSYLYGKIIYFLISIVYLDGMANSAFHSSLVNLKANKPISLNANVKNMLLFIFGYLINNNICMKLLRMKFLLKYSIFILILMKIYMNLAQS